MRHQNASFVILCMFIAWSFAVLTAEDNAGASAPPLQMALEKAGPKTILKISRPAVKIQLWEGSTKLSTFAGGSKTKFDITPHIAKMKVGKLTVKADDGKKSYEKTFNVSAQLAALEKSTAPSKKKKAGKPPEQKAVEEKGAATAKDSAPETIPLRVDKIYLEGEKIAVMLSNPEGEDLRNINYSRSTLTIEGPGVRGTYPFAKVDSRRLLAKKPFRLDFTSPLVPSSSGAVQVTLRAGSRERTAVGRINVSAAGEPGAPESGIFGGLGKKRRKGGRPPGGGVPIMLEGAGLMITSPVRGNQFMQGDTINVSFFFNPDVEPLAVTEVSLRDGDDAAVQTITPATGLIPAPSREMTVSLQIPEGLPADTDYTVRVQTAGEPYGRSDPFQVGLIFYGPMHIVTPGGVQVSLEGGNRIRHLGERFNVTLVLTDSEVPGFYREYEPGLDLLLGLRPPGVSYEQMGLWIMYSPYEAATSEDGRRITVPAFIPDDIEEGDGYIISYAHRDGESYGHSAPFTVRPPGVEAGEMHVSSPAEGEILRSGVPHTVQWTLYDRETMEGLSYRVELLRDPPSRGSGIFGGILGGTRGRDTMRIIDTADVSGSCSPDGSGNIRCSASYAPGSGGNAAHFDMNDSGHEYKLRVSALSGGEAVMLDASPRFTVLDYDTVGDFVASEGDGGLRVTEAGRLEARVRFREGGAFSRPVPFTVRSRTVEATVSSSGEWVWVDLGRLTDFFDPGSDEYGQLIFGAMVNTPQRYYELNRDNNRSEAMLPTRTHYGGAHVEGYAAGSTMYWQDYERDWTGKRWCCESEPLIVMRNRGYQPVSGRLEVRQVGRWAEADNPGELAVPSNHNDLLQDTDLTLEPGQLRRIGLFPYGVRPAYSPSTIEVYLHGGLADWISPNPKIFTYQYRDVFR